MANNSFAYFFCSWHEIGTYDLPAMIDYVLQTTGREKLFYLGHSQGTTAFFVMSTQLPEYQDKIEAMFAMAPIAYCGRMKSPFLQMLAQFTYTVDVRIIPIQIKKINHRRPLLRIKRVVADVFVLNRLARIQPQRLLRQKNATNNVREKSSHATNMLECDVSNRWIQS